jgi:hypothetical protein
MTTSKEGFGIKIEPSSKVILFGWIVVGLFLAFLILITSPFEALLGPSQWALASTLHGTLAILGAIVETVAAYLGWKLYNGQLKANGDLKIIAALSVIASTAAIIFGNWVYIGYRGPGGPRAWFLANNPSVHNVFFEFKEFLALFTAPLSVGAAYIIWAFKDSLSQDKSLRTTVALLLITTWILFMVTFLLGAGITKLRSV